MASIKARPSRYQQLSAQAAEMLALGESGRFEFKKEPAAVTPAVLAALANWVALDPSREVAHVLVGVEEVTDEATGLVSGRPCGLERGLDRAVARMQDVSSTVRPIPVDVHIVEEGIATKSPFVRIEVRPTMPPHFDDQGRRQTRQGRSTRALTDEEMLQIYLQREAGTFASRFRQVSEELHGAVGNVGGQIDSIAEAIEARVVQPLEDLSEVAGMASHNARMAGDAAEAASSSAEDVSYNVRNVEDLLEDVRSYVGALLDHAEGAAAADLAKKRRQVWLALSLDSWERRSPRAAAIVERGRALLATDISLDPARNEWELRVWTDALTDRKAQRRGSGTLAWWDATLKEVASYVDQPCYDAPELPDLRAELQTKTDFAFDDPSSETRQFAELAR